MKENGWHRLRASCLLADNLYQRAFSAAAVELSVIELRDYLGLAPVALPPFGPAPSPRRIPTMDLPSE